MPETTQPSIVVVPRSTIWSRLGWIGFIICGILLMSSYATKEAYFDTSGGIEERYHSGAKQGDDKLAIVSLSGLIVEGDGFVKRQIDRIREDESVKAIVLRVNSPGGTVYGSDFIYHHLKKLRDERELPLVVSMGSMAASGGYYVSMAVGEQEDSIFAEPTTTTGSIGVIIPHYDVSGLMERYDVQNDSISSHPRKQMLSMTRAMPEEHRDLLQSQVNEMFERFKQIVHEGRPLLRNPENELKYNDRDLATGEIFSGPQAKEFGLVDRIGFIEEAIERAIELAGLNKDKVRVIRYEDPQSLLPFGLVQSQTSLRSELSGMLELPAPRPYYVVPQIPLWPQPLSEN